MATLHSISKAMLATDVPSYISARSANSIISEVRPTRIQAETLSFLNRILDELLLFIVASSRSLATDRIKTDGLLKVLNNNNLAKDAVLEAELELRNYLQGKKAEGGRVPLGLSATSRWDGTEAFPVSSAYNALRTRCQYYSTLGDREDDSATGDQHIMSSEGRPIATITPGVSIYVTALLEFVGEYILQHVSQIIERDNSDEASLADLRAAIEEDEALITLWRQMVVKQELDKRMAVLAAAGGSRRVTKPWQVPDSDELDEAAGAARWKRQMPITHRPGTAASAIASTPPAGWNTRDRNADSLSGHDFAASDSQHHPDYAFSDSHANYATGPTVSTTTAVSPSQEDSSAGTPGVKRRSSVDRGFSGFFSGRRRGSFRASQDASQLGQLQGTNMSSTSAKDVKTGGAAAEPADDFEALMMSGQTMKVSLTPNRLRTIEVARQEAAAKKEARHRPGTLNIAALKNEAGAIDPSRAAISPSVSMEDASPIRPASRNSLVGATANATRKAGARVSNPPSSYRGPDASQSGHKQTNCMSATTEEGINAEIPLDKSMVSRTTAGLGSDDKRMLPRDKRTSWSTAKDLIDLLNSTPPSPLARGGQFSGPPAVGIKGNGSSVPSSQDASIGKITGVGGKVRALWGRRSNSGKESPGPGFRSESRQSTTTMGSAHTTDQQIKSTASPTPEPDDLASNQEEPSKTASFQSHDTSSDNNLFGPSERVTRELLLAGTAHREAARQGASKGGSATLSEEVEKDDPSLSVTQTPMPQTLGQNTPSDTISAESSHRRAPIGFFDERAGSLRVSSGSSATPALTPELTSASSLQQSRPEGPPSRKIPYGRRASRDDGVMPLGRRASLQTPINEGGDALHRSLAESSYERSNGTRSAVEHDVYNTPVGRASAAFFSSSAAQVGLRGTLDSRKSGQADGQSTIISVLANLSAQMKLCSTVEECRDRVNDALRSSLRSLSTDVPGESQSGESLSIPLTTMEEPRQPCADLKNLAMGTPMISQRDLPSHAEKRQVPRLIMAADYNEDDDEYSIAFRQGGCVAAWLLGNNEDPCFSVERKSTAPVESLSDISQGQDFTIQNQSASPVENGDAPHILNGGLSVRERKVSQTTVDEAQLYASADEGDIEDEEETSTESERHGSEFSTAPAMMSTPISAGQSTFPPGSHKIKRHPPSAGGAALQLSTRSGDGGQT